VSASGTEVVEPIAAALGADRVVATRMEIVDGRYTGGIDFYAYGENKAVAVRELAERYSYDLDEAYAYSDLITDAPMLGAVGHGFVVNPDRTLRRLAAEEGWDVLTFTRPVAIEAFLTPRRRIAVGVALATVAGVVVWAVQRRRR